MRTRCERALVLVVVLLGAALPVWPGAPGLISYQGQLNGAGGAPVTSPMRLRFRVYLGGSGSSQVSGGALRYDETAFVQPDSSGIFAHHVGTGTPAPICDDGGCTLSAADFGDGSIPVWIEVRVDPDGMANTADDDVLLPRTRVGSVGYAFRVASLDGATGGSLAGSVSADTLVGRDGATLGDGSAGDVSLTFDGASSNAAATWVDAAAQLAFSGETRHDAGLSVAPNRALRFGSSSALTQDSVLGRLVLGAGYDAMQLGDGVGRADLFFESALPFARLSWLPAQREFEFTDTVRFREGLALEDVEAMSYGPFTNPVPGAHIRYYKSRDLFADGNLDGVPDMDHVVGICYNCAEQGGAEVPTEYSMRAQWEMTYSPVPGTRTVEHNWNFHSPGNALYRPLLFYLDTDSQGGFANPTGKWKFMTDRTKVALAINQNGNVSLGSDAVQPTRQLEVWGDSYLRGNLQLGSCGDVAAADTVTANSCGVVKLLGAATVNRIQDCGAQQAGRVLYVMCGANPTTLCDGDGSRCAAGNLRLAGSAADFVCTPNDVVTLVCDGGTWLQVGLSAN